MPNAVSVAGGSPDLASGGQWCRGVLVELQQVVGGVDEPPFRPAGRSASSEESVAAAVELGVAEDGLDHALAPGVELAARLGGEDSAHERVEPALPARALAFALVGVGRNED